MLKLKSLLLALALPLFACACGGEGSHPSGGLGGSRGMGGAPNFPMSKCDEGASKECTYNRKTASGVVICGDGTKFCVDGRWSECYADSASSE